MGCGDAPCAALPAPRRGRRRRLSEALLHARPPHSNRTSVEKRTAFGDNSSGGRDGGRKNAQGAPRGQGNQLRLVDDFGTLLPEQNDSAAAGTAASGTGGGCDGRQGGGAAQRRQQGRNPGRDGGCAALQSWGGGAGGPRGRQLAGRKAKPPAWPLPMFSYDTSESHSDIPFPDFSYWGHEQDRLWGQSCRRHHASHHEACRFSYGTHKI